MAECVSSCSVCVLSAGYLVKFGDSISVAESFLHITEISNVKSKVNILYVCDCF